MTLGSGKADFLRIRDALDLEPEALRMLAPMLGFEPPVQDAWQPERAPVLHADPGATTAEPARKLSVEPEPFSKVPFFRLDQVEHEDPAFDKEETGPVPSAEPFTFADIAPLRDVAYRETPLQTEWPQLWPMLFDLIREERFGRDLNTDALVQAVCRLDPLDRVPRHSWLAWPESLTLLIDRSTRQLPMWTDQSAVKRKLQALLGEANVRAIDLGTSFPQPEETGTSTCLALTDLGLGGSEAERSWWRREGQRRLGLGQRLFALVPAHPRHLDAQSPWTCAAWSPPHAWCSDQSDAARRSRVHDLLTLLVPAHRVDHGLVRELRQQLGLRSGDLQTELDVWSSPELDVGGGLAGGWRADAIQVMRPVFKDSGKHEDKALAVQLLKAWHGRVFERDVWPEEVAGLRELLNGPDLDLKSAIEEVLAEVAEPRDVLGARLFATMKGDDPAVAESLGAWLRGYVDRAPNQVFHKQHGTARDSAGDYNPWFEALLAAPPPKYGPAVLGGGLEARDLRRAGETDQHTLAWTQTTSGLQFGLQSGSPVANLKSKATTFVLRRPGQLDQRQPTHSPHRWGISPADLPRPLPEPVPPWADRAGRDKYGGWAEVDVKGVVLKMRWIEPGTFWMGSAEDEGYGDECPRHQVTLTEGYWMAETPCTQALWRAVTGDSPSEFEGEQRPVERVSWEEVQGFVESMETLIPGIELCLPTEAQWEHACRAGSDEARYGELEDIAWLDDNSDDQTHPVATKAPNAWGLYDTLGNVYEWCHDSQRDYSSEPVTNPVGPIRDTTGVFRGGSWRSSPQRVRAAGRLWLRPSTAGSLLGFRVSRGRAKRKQEGAGGKRGVRPGPGGRMIDDQELQVQTVYDLLIHAAKSQAATDPTEISNQVMADLLEKDLTKVPFNPAIAHVAIRNRRISNHRRRMALKNGGGVQKVALTNYDTSDPAPNPEQALLIREKVAQTAKAVSTLPSDSREVLRLWNQGYTPPEIAQLLGMTDHAVRARFRRAHGELRDADAKEIEDERCSDPDLNKDMMGLPIVAALVDALDSDLLDEPTSETDALSHAQPTGPVVLDDVPTIYDPDGDVARGQDGRTSESLQTSESGIVLITDRAKARLGLFERPEWASYVGRDKYGLFCEVEVEAVKESVMPVSFRMRWIPPGQFMMGSLESDSHDSQHLVTLTEGYWMADTPCTQALWIAVMDDNPSSFTGLERPVEMISWDGTQQFFRALDLQLPGMSLPTEAQWEHACRAGTEHPRYGELPHVGWYDDNSADQTHPVGLKAANGFGLYDTLGNVWEWCHDLYAAYGDAHAVDPSGAIEGSGPVLRGGGWNSPAHLARAAYRYAYGRSNCFSSSGFRLSRGHSALQQQEPGGHQDVRPGPRGTSGQGVKLQRSPSESGGEKPGLLQRAKGWFGAEDTRDE